MAPAALAELVHILVYTSARELQCDSVENKDKLRLTLSTSTLGQLQASHLCFFEASGGVFLSFNLPQRHEVPSPHGRPRG